MNTTHLMINIYMVTVKRNDQVFALGIRLHSVQGQNGGLETQGVEHEEIS